MLSSCSLLTNTTREAAYPKMYEEKPTTILVMPPINNTNAVEAKDYFYTSLAQPLSEKGYYVLSPFLAMNVLQEESAYDSELFIDANLKPFNTIFGADVALFTIINKWSKVTLGNMISVDIEYIFKSTKTNEVLFSRKGVINVDTSVSSGLGGSYAALIDMALSAANTALTDKVIAARRCNVYVLKDLPSGVYSPLFDKDQTYSAGGPVVRGTVKQ
jgi:hypothetical protein